MNHQEFYHGLRVAYWRFTDTTSIAADKANASSCSVAPIGKCWPEFKFELPAQQHDFDKLIAVAAAAAASADYKARAEIRAVLGVRERS